MRSLQRIDRGLKARLPRPAYHFIRRRYYDARVVAGRNPGRARLLPDFLVIGTAKSGTTTLFGWLSEHPFVEPASQKEVHYFDYEFQRGLDWYRSHFPLQSSRGTFEREHGRPFVTGEASPTYISHTWAPGRVAATLPDAKLVVAFRNPIDRAYSQFQMSRREGVEPLESFGDAVAAEEERLGPQLARMRADQHYYGWWIGCWSYLMRSNYAEQVERWFELFPREQFHFVSTEKLESEPQSTLDGVYAFLGLPEHRNAGLEHLHVAPQYDPMPTEVRAELVEYFRPRNERLYELVGTDFGWDR